jgi:hypothetical protein
MSFDGDDFQVLDTAWNSAPGRRKQMIAGTIALEADSPEYAELMALYAELRQKHDITLPDCDADIEYDEEDRRSASWLQVMEHEAAELAEGSIGDGQALLEQCKHCHRSVLQLQKPLRIAGLRKLRGVLCRIDNDELRRLDALSAGWLVSAAMRRLLEQIDTTGISCEDVIDASSGRVSKDYFQMNIANRMPPMLAPKLDHGEVCGACGKSKGVFMPGAANPLDREVHFRRSELPSCALALSSELLGEPVAQNDGARLLFVSQSVYQGIRKAKIKGVECWPVRLDD